MEKKTGLKSGRLFGEPSDARKKSADRTMVQLPGGLPPLDLDWLAEIANSPAKDTGYTRTFYSYPAKFQAPLPNQLVAASTQPGDLVCDPYSGGGTTGLECLLLNRRFVGYDLSSFAVLISRVKTTKIKTDRIYNILPQTIQVRSKPSANIFDEGDIECIGKAVANEINCIFENIVASELPHTEKDFLKLALIHTIKIIGRRDFTRNVNDAQKILFDEVPMHTALPLFEGKVKKMLTGIAEIPKTAPRPKFFCASNHHMKLENQCVDLIVTSPPYKDLDVEYGLIQLQRPKLKRSKRSKAIWKILGVKAVAKDKLCGERGGSYWKHLTGSLTECHRVMKKKHLAFFWIGFKTESDQETFCSFLNDYGLRVEYMIPVRLGDDRVASSRSTHHGRDTGMMARDYLIVTRCI